MTAATTPAALSGTGFRHEALLYAGTDDFLGAVVPFVTEGLKCGEPVLAVLAPEKLSALRAALGSDGDGVTFADMTELGQNPARILPAWREFVDGAADVPRRGIGEPIWAGRSPVELIECQRHEALLNVAFDSSPALWILCPYDTSELDESIIVEARRSHPHLMVGGKHEQSLLADPDSMATAHLDAPLPSPPELGPGLSFGVDDVRIVRDHVASHIVASGMDAARGFDLLVAASEIATNSLRYGGGQGDLRVWHDGQSVICEFADSGSLVDPLAGREQPEPDEEGRRGLWIANQLCDLVQIRVFKSGTVVRIHMGVRGS